MPRLPLGLLRCSELLHRPEELEDPLLDLAAGSCSPCPTSFAYLDLPRFPDADRLVEPLLCYLGPGHT
jgi:hypothetical protein